jgi:GDPmannose 4,6-dehydratase
LARIDAGLDNCIYMGNLDSLLNCGHASNYLEIKLRMLQQEGSSEDFVIATGRRESVRRFIELSAKPLGWGDIQNGGSGINEIGIRADAGKSKVRIEPRCFRPAEVESLAVEPAKAHSKLGWNPTTALAELIIEMWRRIRVKSPGFQVCVAQALRLMVKPRFIPLGNHMIKLVLQSPKQLDPINY